MQNRFKFRAWNTMTKTMKEIAQLTFDKDTIQSRCYDKNKTTLHLLFQKHIILMQSTGLKDKTGKLIYEGDILKFYAQSIIDAMAREPLKERIGVAVWNEEELKFDVSVDNGKNVVPNLCKKTDDNNFEIIGNIYENPELLEVKCK